MSNAPSGEGHKYTFFDFAQYGPYAFGVLSLLMIWFTIVKPQLDRQLIDYSQHQLLVDKVKEMSSNQVTASSALERTSVILDQLVKELRSTSGNGKYKE